MRTVWKYQLKLGRNEIEMPVGAVALTAGLDPPGEACVWAEVDSDLTGPGETDLRVLTIYGTGHEIPDHDGHIVYICSFKHGVFMWHVYEELVDAPVEMC